MYTSEKKIVDAKRAFEKHGGILRTSEAIRYGIHPRTLYYMRDHDYLDILSRGTYHLRDLEPVTNIDIITIASRVKSGVVCLISALSYHEITTEIPHEIYMAISRKTSYPKLKHPPARFFRFSEKAFKAGVEIHVISGVNVRIYSAEKTIADCFKYRNKLGLDVALEALKLWRKGNNIRVDKLMEYANICRVYNVMKPYVEAML
jgi:predicted transcriptional regulator of viral defense system